MVPVSCEFVAPNTESLAMVLYGQDAPKKWVVSDDWTLTEIVNAPRLDEIPLWPSLPVLYAPDSTAYPTRADIAAGRWNAGVGREVLRKTGDITLAKITVVGVYKGLGTFPNYTWFGKTMLPNANGVIKIKLNKSWLDIWTSTGTPSYSYGFEGREHVIGHEMGHAFGLAHITAIDPCELLEPFGDIAFWDCSVYAPTTGDVNGFKALDP